MTATCQHCGGAAHKGTCPRISAIEYFENGGIKRVEYHPPPVRVELTFDFGPQDDR